MIRPLRHLAAFAIAIVATALPLAGVCDPGASKVGIVIMHGKGGSPTKHVNGLASGLEEKGFLVANLEMPWSGRRDYDVDVSTAEKEVESALATLRSNGARKVFVAGHSQGGIFALYFGSKHVVDGVIAIAPGGDVSSPSFREQLGEPLELARKLVAEGKGGEKAKFADFEGGRGAYPVVCTASSYLSWFDPEGAMGQAGAPKNMNPQIPVLYIGPSNDYPGLIKAKKPKFDSLPPNPLTRLYEPNSNHLGAPSASRDEIVRWISQVDGSAGNAQ